MVRQAHHAGRKEKSIGRGSGAGRIARIISWAGYQVAEGVVCGGEAGGLRGTPILQGDPDGAASGLVGWPGFGCFLNVGEFLVSAVVGCFLNKPFGFLQGFFVFEEAGSVEVYIGHEELH